MTTYHLSSVINDPMDGSLNKNVDNFTETCLKSRVLTLTNQSLRHIAINRNMSHLNRQFLLSNNTRTSCWTTPKQWWYGGYQYLNTFVNDKTSMPTFTIIFTHGHLCEDEERWTNDIFVSLVNTYERSGDESVMAIIIPLLDDVMVSAEFDLDLDLVLSLDFDFDLDLILWPLHSDPTSHEAHSFTFHCISYRKGHARVILSWKTACMKKCTPWTYLHSHRTRMSFLSFASLNYHHMDL